MKRTFPLLFAAALLVGCSTAAQTPVAEPHEHRPYNTIRPGNGVGNSLSLAPSYEPVNDPDAEEPEPFEWSREDLGWANAVPLSERRHGQPAEQQMASAETAEIAAPPAAREWADIPWQDVESE